MPTVHDDLITSLSRTTEQMFSLEELKQMLSSGRQLRIKYGVDVTAPYLHIGHAVNLWMMRKMQDRGHKVLFLIGDFTTRIGDPTGKNKTRPVIPQAEIEANTEKFIEQARMVLRFDDPNLLEIHKNSDWFGHMPMAKFLELLSMVTHAKLISRDMFRKRIECNEEIYMHEMIYPILQGYDSYVLQADLTIIGSDQLFNEMLGRFFQEKLGQSPQVIITSKITPGIDGKAKQSKSLDNYIGLGHSPRDKFGRTMSLPDRLIIEYFHVYTEVPETEINEIGKKLSTEPMACKKQLAQEIVKRYHGEEAAITEKEWFEQTFSQREVPESIPVISIQHESIAAIQLIHTIYHGAKSNSELRRLFHQGAVKIDNNKITNPNEIIPDLDDFVVKIGKRSWFRIMKK